MNSQDIAGGFDCAVIGSAKDDEQAIWHINQFSELLTILYMQLLVNGVKRHRNCMVLGGICLY